MKCLEIPDFLYGTAPAVRQAVRREGMRWARAYKKSGQFPQIPVQPVAADQIVVIDATSDFSWDGPKWRAYLWGEMKAAIQSVRKDVDRRPFGHEFDKYSLDTAYGTISVVTAHTAPCSADRVAQRLEASRLFYEELCSVRYQDWQRPSCSFDDVLWYHYEGLFLLSGMRPTSDSLADLNRLIAWLRSADRKTLADGVVRCMLGFARSNSAIQNRRLLSEDQLIREKIAAMSNEEFDMLSGGDSGAIQTQVLLWDRALGTK